jgi:hypothetical protein
MNRLKAMVDLLGGGELKKATREEAERHLEVEHVFGVSARSAMELATREEEALRLKERSEGQ